MSEATQLTTEELIVRQTGFWQRYYQAFEGATIIRFVGVVDDDLTANGGFPTFEIRYKDGTIGKMEVSRDPEGNGGGFLFGGDYQ